MGKQLIEKRQAEKLLKKALEEGVIDEAAFEKLKTSIAEEKETPEFPKIKHYYFDRFYKEHKGSPHLFYPYLWDEKDKRTARFERQTKKYGFDERCTWALDYAFMIWLYERLNAYLEFARVDLTFNKWEIDGKTLTEEEVIKRMIDDCEKYFLADDWENGDYFDDAIKVWAMCGQAFWW